MGIGVQLLFLCLDGSPHGHPDSVRRLCLDVWLVLCSYPTHLLSPVWIGAGSSEGRGVASHEFMVRQLGPILAWDLAFAARGLALVADGRQQHD